MVGRAEAELLGETGDGVKDKIELAKLVAGQCEEMGIGERIGCVIVARSQEGLDEEEVVAVVGDTRWCSAATPGMPEADRSGSGNVMAHAVMRAIAMVANKRLRVATNSASNGDCSVLNSQTAYCDGPLTPFESKYYSNDNLTPNGYLCVDLDIYVTHEPCVMCAMAIVHSRFARCIFAKRMPLTGAMTADDDRGLGHGLFWRPAELNWKLMCWEWECDGETDGEVDERLNV